jgi:DNA-directed RNA polymerase subunit RPC12/RpoP
MRPEIFTFGEKATMGHFVNLNCSNCGAKLEIYENLTRFACGYCGTQLMVQRQGGIVSLSAVTEAVRQVQVGTDKTAAELALARLQQERNQWTAEYSRVWAGRSMGGGSVAGLILIVFGFLAMIPLAWDDPIRSVIAVGVLSLLLFLLIRNYRQRRQRTDQALGWINKRVYEIDIEIARNRRVVQP